MINLGEIVDSIKNATDKQAAELPPDGDWSPMLFVVKGGNVKVIGIDMPPHEFRDWWFSSVIPSLVKKLEQEPDAVVMLTSAWTRQMEDDEDLEDMKMMPSEDPNRREVIVIEAVSHEEEISLMGEIIRSENHPELEWSNPTGMEGRMMIALRRSVWT